MRASAYRSPGWSAPLGAPVAVSRHTVCSTHSIRDPTSCCPPRRGRVTSYRSGRYRRAERAMPSIIAPVAAACEGDYHDNKNNNGNDTGDTNNNNNHHNNNNKSTDNGNKTFGARLRRRRSCAQLTSSLPLLLLSAVGCLCNPDAKRLYDDLLSNYNRLIRPVSNNTDTVLVKLGLRLSQLIELVRHRVSSVRRQWRAPRGGGGAHTLPRHAHRRLRPAEDQRRVPPPPHPTAPRDHATGYYVCSRSRRCIL